MVGTKLLDKAARIAASAHEHQVDKAGEAYILHPLRLITRAQSGDERMVARGSRGSPKSARWSVFARSVLV